MMELLANTFGAGTKHRNFTKNKWKIKKKKIRVSEVLKKLNIDESLKRLRQSLLGNFTIALQKAMDKLKLV